MPHDDATVVVLAHLDDAVELHLVLEIRVGRHATRCVTLCAKALLRKNGNSCSLAEAHRSYGLHKAWWREYRPAIVEQCRGTVEVEDCGLGNLVAQQPTIALAAAESDRNLRWRMRVGVADAGHQ